MWLYCIIALFDCVYKSANHIVISIEYLPKSIINLNMYFESFGNPSNNVFTYKAWTKRYLFTLWQHKTVFQLRNMVNCEKFSCWTHCLTSIQPSQTSSCSRRWKRRWKVNFIHPIPKLKLLCVNRWRLNQKMSSVTKWKSQ